MAAAWSSGIGFELRYWDHWLASRGGTDSRLPGTAVSTRDFLRRLNASTPFSFENRLARHVARRPPREVRAQTHFRVLDVGSGPVPGAGYRMTRPGWSMELFASDALAKPYDQLLAKHGVVPPLRVTQLRCEELTERYNEDYFDMVLSVNALDHARDPVQCVRQMATVAKPGGLIFVMVHPNEALHADENERGFHNWNLANVDGRLVLHGASLARDVDLQHEVHDLVVRQTCDFGSRVSDKLKLGASATEGSPLHGRLSPTDRFGVHQWDAGGRIMCELHKRWNASWHASFRGLRRGREGA